MNGFLGYKSKTRLIICRFSGFNNFSHIVYRSRGPLFILRQFIAVKVFCFGVDPHQSLVIDMNHGVILFAEGKKYNTVVYFLRKVSLIAGVN